MSKLVIDVSYAQGALDWDALSGHIDGAIIQCGYGSDYGDQDDVQFARNVSECERLGIPYGVYLYSYASDDGMAASEADHLLRLLPDPSRLSYPAYLDVEQPGCEGYFRRACEVVGPRIEAAGYWFGWYSGRANANAQGLGGLPYTAWVAEYGAPLAFDGADMWQYTSTESVNGVNQLDASECYRDFPAEIRGGAPAPDPAPAPAPAPSGGATYIVRSGDTLSAIGAKYGVGYMDIASANGIADPNVIYPGQVLAIPGGAPSGGVSYTVQPGDTLSGIASANGWGGDWAGLAAKNGIADPNVIYPGQVISL